METVEKEITGILGPAVDSYLCQKLTQSRHERFPRVMSSKLCHQQLLICNIVLYCNIIVSNCSSDPNHHQTCSPISLDDSITWARGPR